jgi:hypothetical protein
MRKFLVIGACLLLVFAVYLSHSTVDTNVPVAVAKHAKTYSGKLYVAGMGGHFTVADVEIDPSNTSHPIKVNNLDRIVIGSKDTHPTHDARIDSNDRAKMYWSTYKIDKKAKGKKMHVGLSDLKTGKVLMDKAIDLPKRGLGWTGALYCGSGQTEKSFLPVTMSNESYIDVFDKKSLKLKKRVYLEELGYKNNYFFFHGTNSPDMKTFAVTINLTKQWSKPSAPAARKGLIDMLLLDLPSLEKGKVKVLAKNTITGDPKKTLTFRQYFTEDGKYLLQSGADRFYLIDGKTMELLDEEMLTDGENHDAIGTPDSKYAILTLRTKVGADPNIVTDGTVQLYDIGAKKVIGEPVSVCLDCHKKIGLGGNAILCGLDANWK